MKNILSIGLITLFSLGAFASHHEMMGMMDENAKLTKEQREAMAKTHDKMAVCLRSEKSMKECHQEMMSECEKSDSGMACPMMKMHKMMKNGKMKHHDADESAKATEKTEKTEEKK